MGKHFRLKMAVEIVAVVMLVGTLPLAAADYKGVVQGVVRKGSVPFDRLQDLKRHRPGALHLH